MNTILPDAEWIEVPLRADEDDPETYREIFERAHRDRMLLQAEKYAATLPSLEWIFCGQWPMAIEEHENGISRTAIPLGTERDTCFTALSRMFSMEGDDI